MSDAILEALMQLFALIIDIDENNKISEREKEVVRSFLTQQLNRKLSEKYMIIFEEYLLQFHKDDYYQNPEKRRKRRTLTARKIVSICEKVNEELQQNQKIYVIIQLIEFISLGELVSERETEFLTTVSNAFKIPKAEFRNIFSFIVGTVHDIPDKDKVLVINNKERCHYDIIKHKFEPHISGELFFLRIESTKTYVLRYYGYADIYLNSQNILSGRTYAFEHGSSIRSQSMKTIFYTDVAGRFSSIAPGSNITVAAKDVTYWFKNTHNGIQKFNMNAKSGTLVAVMGGSGVGKSTLINVLNGTLKPNKGEVFFNGHNLNYQDERNRLKGVIGLVPQEDLLIEDLTVYQNLYYCAKLCLDGLNEDEITGAIDKVLNELDLLEIKDLKVGSPLKKVISGGQRKRLNIAMELIREPHVLFIDEPTSGLSSLDAENVMNLIKEQADKGKLVIVNIHQPSSYLYKMFDKVLILDKGGYQIFYGNPMEAIVYFKRMTNHANPNEDQCETCGTVNTDQLLQIIDAKVVNEHGKLTNARKVSPEEWSKLFEKNIKIDHEVAKSNIEIPHSRFHIPGKIKQTFLYFKRDLVSKLANKQYVIISLIEAPLLALILGYFTKYIDVTEAGTGKYIFYQNENIPAYLFMCVIVSLFLGLIGSSEEIIKDRKVLKREVFLNLSRASYLNSKVMVLFILAAIQTISFVFVGNTILEIKGMTLSYWIILYSTNCFAILMGLNISSGFNRVITVYILIPFLLIPQLLLSGVIVNFDKLHKSFTNFDNVPFIGDLMTSRWSYEALAVHQFKDNEFEKITFEHDMKSSQNTFYCDFLIPKLYEKTQLCEHAIGVEKWRDDFQENLAKLSKYITFLSDVSGMHNEHIMNNLNKESFDTITARLMIDYLNELKIQFRSEANESIRKRDSIIDRLDNINGKGYTSGLENKYQNENLKKFLRNQNRKYHIIETDTRLIQKVDPVYRIPISRTGRAHFYAPVKRLGNLSVDTYWFNLVVIWLFTLMLYITLYYDSLRKVLNYFDKPSKV